jgi:hypothetical protein
MISVVESSDRLRPFTFNDEYAIPWEDQLLEKDCVE